MSEANYPQRGGRIEVTTVFDRFLDSNIMKTEWTKKDIVSFGNSTQRIAMTPMDTAIYEALIPGQPFDSVAVADKMNMFYGDWATLFGTTDRISRDVITANLEKMGLTNPKRVPFEHLEPVDVKNYIAEGPGSMNLRGLCTASSMIPSAFVRMSSSMKMRLPKPQPLTPNP